MPPPTFTHPLIIHFGLATEDVLNVWCNAMKK